MRNCSDGFWIIATFFQIFLLFQISFLPGFKSVKMLVWGKNSGSTRCVLRWLIWMIWVTPSDTDTRYQLPSPPNVATVDTIPVLSAPLLGRWFDTLSLTLYDYDFGQWCKLTWERPGSAHKGSLVCSSMPGEEHCWFSVHKGRRWMCTRLARAGRWVGGRYY